MKDKQLASKKDTWFYIIGVCGMYFGTGFLCMIGVMGGLMYLWNTTRNLPVIMGMCFTLLAMSYIGIFCYHKVKQKPSKYKGWDAPRHKTWEHIQNK